MKDENIVCAHVPSAKRPPPQIATSIPSAAGLRDDSQRRVAESVFHVKRQVQGSKRVTDAGPGSIRHTKLGWPILFVIVLAREKDLRVLGGCEDANTWLNSPSMYLSQAISTGPQLLLVAWSARYGLVRDFMSSL